jgi:hypothetical protein
LHWYVHSATTNNIAIERRMADLRIPCVAHPMLKDGPVHKRAP